MSAPTILVVSLGGTIAMAGDRGVVPVFDAADLVAAVPALAEVAAIEAMTFRRLPSASLSLADLAALADLLRERVAGGVAGAVVVQGTDTIEETAFLLDVMLDVGKPVVVTGAMRPPQTPGADGPANLLSAVIVAASAEAAGQGVLVVLNDEIHAARFVRKIHTAKPSAFASPDNGPVGMIAEGSARFVVRLPALPTLPVAAGACWPAVALVRMTLSDDGRLLPLLSAAGYRGLVLEGMGAGHVPAAVAPLVSELIHDMPVVLASRTGGGATFSGTYGFDGSEMDLLRRGVIAAGRLEGLKARLLLAVLLARNASIVERAAMFAAYGSC